MSTAAKISSSTAPPLLPSGVSSVLHNCAPSSSNAGALKLSDNALRWGCERKSHTLMKSAFQAREFVPALPESLLSIRATRYCPKCQRTIARSGRLIMPPTRPTKIIEIRTRAKDRFQNCI